LYVNTDLYGLLPARQKELERVL